MISKAGKLMMKPRRGPMALKRLIHDERRSVSIFAYEDYRAYLRELGAHLKRKGGEAFSYRSLSRLTGLSSTACYGCMTGKARLTGNMCGIFGTAFGLDGREQGYLESMLELSTASETEKKGIRDRMVTLKPIIKERLTAEQTGYSSQPELIMLANAIPMLDVGDDFARIGAFMNPPMVAVRVEKAVRELEKMGIIEKDAHGIWVKRHRAETLGHFADSRRIMHRYMSDLGKRAMDCIPREERNMVGLTLGISEDSFRKINMKIEELMRFALALAVHESNPPTRGYHLGVQFFPYTEKADSRRCSDTQRQAGGGIP